MPREHDSPYQQDAISKNRPGANYHKAADATPEKSQRALISRRQRTNPESEQSSLDAHMNRHSIDDAHADQSSQRIRGPNKRQANDTEDISRPLKQQTRHAPGRSVSRQDSEVYSPRSPVPQPLSATPLAHGRHQQDPSSPTSVLSRPPNQSPVQASPSSDCQSDTPLFREPDTRPISEQQLINEVKGIYAGLVMVEKKCVEIVTSQSQSTKRLENQQWKALVALHRTLLQEHHDFFSASQHPTASDALKRLAIKYAMPARMWRHGIHAFLELLRHRLPDSMEHMLSFIYLSYSMIALLKESVTSFVETWIECLGDLARYRMAIEDSDPRDREIWSNVARMWYNEAADKSPNVGRIQHHLAVLARPNIVEQLFYYTKALISVVPFVNARESIMLLFDMFSKNNEAMQARYLASESSLVHAFAILFTRGSIKQFYAMRDRFAANFGAHIDRSGPKLKIQGTQIAMGLLAGMVDFGKDDSRLYKMYLTHSEKVGAKKQKLMEAHNFSPGLEAEIKRELQREEFDALTFDSKVERIPAPPPPTQDSNITSSDQVISMAGLIFRDAVSITAARIGDKNIVTFMHAVLSSLWGWSFVPGALVFLEPNVPWNKIAMFLNTIGRSGISYNNIESEGFPPTFGGFGKQLPEDFHLRGFIMTQHYYPTDFFAGQLVDEDERTVELPSHQAPRAERCLWLGVRLASLGRWLTYDDEAKQFGTTEFAESL